MGNILLIDDVETQLRELEAALQTVLQSSEAEVRLWVPSKNDPEPPRDQFNKLVDANTTLVVTDYDLTKGQLGLFGSSIVDWCQAKLIPVGDFSKGLPSALPKEPNLFEIRIPTQPEEAAAYIAGVYRGFEQISAALNAKADSLLHKNSPIGVLSEILGRAHEESRFTLYGSRLAAASPALLEKLKVDVSHPGEVRNEQSNNDQKVRLLSYVLGHLLLTVILRFAGPLLSEEALAAYLAIAKTEIAKIDSLFKRARYTGPFADTRVYYWLSDVDDALDEMMRENPAESNVETQGQLNREALERKLKQKLSRHDCKRCGGQNGGFICPFTSKTVCQLPNCSVAASSWIPAGARLCRVEREFYDEWSPILGF